MHVLGHPSLAVEFDAGRLVPLVVVVVELLVELALDFLGCHILKLLRCEEHPGLYVDTADAVGEVVLGRGEVTA